MGVLRGAVRGRRRWVHGELRYAAPSSGLFRGYEYAVPTMDVLCAAQCEAAADGCVVSVGVAPSSGLFRGYEYAVPTMDVLCPAQCEVAADGCVVSVGAWRRPPLSSEAMSMPRPRWMYYARRCARPQQMGARVSVGACGAVLQPRKRLK